MSAIHDALSAIIDPYTGKALGKKAVSVSAGERGLRVALCLGYPLSDRLFGQHKALIKEVMQEHEVSEFDLEYSHKIRSHKIVEGLKVLPGVKNVIAVSSGKGGVGKSTVAVNLALALSRMGARVGLLDADIYGPNVPAMLGVELDQVNVAAEEKVFEPVMAQGIQSISMGYLVADGKAMVWRGPMVSGALLQLAQQTRWDSCDYLIIDLPPGTGDVQLTLSKKIPVTAAAVVTTPQVVALLDVQKGIAMFDKVGVPVAGLVENMSGFTCPHCQETTAIFSQMGGEALADALSIPFLGRLPLQPELREAGDMGEPLIDHALAQQFEVMAARLAAWVSVQPIDYSHHFSSVKTEI